MRRLSCLGSMVNTGFSLLTLAANLLVDRNVLGEQALDVFKDVKLEDLQTLYNIYPINSLSEKTIEKETKNKTQFKQHNRKTKAILRHQ